MTLVRGEPDCGRLSMQLSVLVGGLYFCRPWRAVAWQQQRRVQGRMVPKDATRSTQLAMVRCARMYWCRGRPSQRAARRPHMCHCNWSRPVATDSRGQLCCFRCHLQITYYAPVHKTEPSDTSAHAPDSIRTSLHPSLPPQLPRLPARCAVCLPAADALLRRAHRLEPRATEPRPGPVRGTLGRGAAGQGVLPEQDLPVRTTRVNRGSCRRFRGGHGLRHALLCCSTLS